MSASRAYELKETLLKVEGVNLWLGGRHILRDVQFEVKNIHRPGMTQGQVIGLLGPSGIGKTQLFRILAGLNVPDSGQVLLEHDQPVRAGMVGVVAQNYPLLAHRTVMGNLVVAGKQAGLNNTDAGSRAQQLLEKFNLEEHGKKYPIQLSGGQRQRIAIAQQFMCSDYLLLMDEPFSGLDPVALRRMVRFIGGVAASDELKTFVIVTHDISAAIEVCDTLWLLGRDKGSEGEFVPGARIQKAINLIDRGLAWREDVYKTPEFHATVDEVTDLFEHL